MRRRLEYEPRPLLRGYERMRLLTLLIMLGVIGMLMFRAKDPKTWAMFDRLAEEPQLVKDADAPATGAEPTSGGTPTESAVSADEPEILGDANVRQEAAKALENLPAIDEDAEERAALQEELQVVEDKAAFQRFEMPAYYRLFRWVMDQSAEKMQKKAIKNVRFGELIDRPAAYRGKLIDIRLKVQRVLPHKDLEENPAGLKTVWELLGYNDSSGVNIYMCVAPELPPDMPYGERVIEDGRFVGYFFKLQAIEDGEGKRRAMPVIVGRFLWDRPISQKSDPQKQAQEFLWGLAVVGIIGLVVILRWGLRKLSGSDERSSADLALRELRRRRSLATGEEPGETDIEDWLTNKTGIPNTPDERKQAPSE